MARRDLALLLVLVASVIALAAVVGGADRGEAASDPRASTFLTSEEGLQALYWTLQELDVPVGRRTLPLVDAPPPRGALALVAPTLELSPAEVAVVLERVRDGGLLVYAASAWQSGGALHDSLGLVLERVRERRSAGGEGWDAAARPHRWTAGVDTVSGFGAVFADSSAALARAGTVPLLTSEGDPVAVAFPLGKGRVLALADAQPLRNERLRESGAATLLARAAAAAGDTLWFDEYHHGFRDEGNVARGTLRRLGAAIPGGAWLQLGLLAALLLWAAGRRFGAPLAPPRSERRSPLEHVEALAGAYRQADARRTARRLLVAGLARRLGRRAPPDERGAAEMLDRIARGSPVAGDAAADVQREWRRGTAADLAALSRAIDRYLQEVRR